MAENERKTAPETVDTHETCNETDKTGTPPANTPGNPRILLRHFLFFLFAVLFWEIVLRTLVSGRITGRNLTMLAFLPAEALSLTAFSGFAKKHPLINKILTIVLLLLLTTYYFAQLVYYRIFTSLISVHLVAMGTDALKNFGWTAKDAILQTLGNLPLLLIPVVVFAVLSFVKFKKTESPLLGDGYDLIIHPVCLAVAVAFWFFGIAGLKCLGTDRSSAYYALKNPMSDTDTTAFRLGAVSTTIIEAGSYYLGIGDTESSVSTVDTDALALGSPSSGSQVSAVTASVSGNGSDTPSEDIFVPEPVIDPAIDFEALKNKSTDESISALCDYFASKPASMTNEYTGMFRDYNLICICAEAFSNYGIDPEVTPLIYEMSQNGIVLNNFYNSFANTTVNGEFAFLTGLWPDVSRTASRGTAVGSFPQSSNLFMPYGPGDLMSAAGAGTYAYHDYYGNYYKRCYSWPNVGYETIKFANDGMTFSSTWPASDLEMMEQSIDDYINEDRFHAYYMTFSGHGPYAEFNAMYQRNIGDVRTLLDGKYRCIDSVAYFCGERELELAMEYLVERLKEAGKLDHTLIVLIGDHYPYQLSNPARIELNGGEALDTVFEQYHSTCILYNAGMSEPIETDTYCCNVDIMPTIWNLLGISYDSRLFAGNDIFSDSLHRARLYNGTLLTDLVRYDSSTGTATWSDLAASYSEAELDAYLQALLDYSDNEYSVSLQMMKTNFYLYVWENSGLLTPAEVEAELAREAAGEEVFAIEAAQDAAAAAAEEAAAAAAEEAAQGQGETPAPAPDGTDPNAVPPQTGTDPGTGTADTPQAETPAE